MVHVLKLTFSKHRYHAKPVNDFYYMFILFIHNNFKKPCLYLNLKYEFLVFQRQITLYFGLNQQNTKYL